MRALASVILIGLLMAGCGSSAEKELVGIWKAKIEMPADTKDNPMAEMAAQMAANSTVEFKADKTFTMNIMIESKGKWSLDGRSLSCTVETIAGQTMAQVAESAKKAGQPVPPVADKPMVFDLSEDGKTLSARADSGMPGSGSLTFTKS